MFKLELTMTQENVERLEELAQRAGVSKEEIVSGALSFFDWAIEEVKTGRVIASVNEKEEKYKVALFPLLDSFIEPEYTAPEPEYTAPEPEPEYPMSERAFSRCKCTCKCEEYPYEGQDGFCWWCNHGIHFDYSILQAKHLRQVEH